MVSRRTSARLAARVPAGALSGEETATSVDSATVVKSLVGIRSRDRKPAASKSTALSSGAASSGHEVEDTPFGASPKNPATPHSKRRRKTESSPPQAVELITSSSTVPPVTPSKRRRKAAPHATNAPLSTPGGSRLTAYPPLVFDAAETNGAGPEPETTETTTENLLEKACAHLISVDPRLKAVIDKHPCRLFSPEGLSEPVDPFAALASGIMGQQVSGAAAASIRRKFIALFPSSNSSSGSGSSPASSFPTPAQVAAAPLPLLRTAGLSQRKAEYISGLAAQFASGALSAAQLLRASDAEIIDTLTAVRGLGRWSVEMFACFGLKRADVFSTGDLGVQRGVARYVGRDVRKLKRKGADGGGGGKWKYISEKEMLDVAERFRPYRSLFMWYMWKFSDVELEVLEPPAAAAAATT